MPFKTPDQIAVAAVASGEKKALLTVDRMLVGGFLAGAYIAFGGLLAIVVTSGLKAETWGGLITLFNGAVFSLGLILVVLAGAELLTGNMALVPLALLQKRIPVARLGINFGVVLVANLLGSLFVAYFLALKTGVIGTPSSPAASTAHAAYERLAATATGKAVTESNWQIFLRAMGCNWLVCLAVWLAMASDEISGKILGIFFPIMAFVALGFDHVVANMFFLPAAHWAGVPGITWGQILDNWVFAGIGNLVGAAVFVAGAYWWVYLRGTEGAVQSAGSDPSGTAGAPAAKEAPVRRARR
ncbi:formate/nitrite transporter [Motilibacter rhizosphaerae]|uniref:Formate/nitrite transporter n=1 Tax=Motilibacter rhizosphaerae TaxID=598652 RepID=A0A4Q7NV42_9ACTN|nr:formate/nitrite transporter family protein [Motilibacter rhizosphaerae]RZS90974.1 formate/nitrite transporter [Motilibacter rhizosphaerae]